MLALFSLRTFSSHPLCNSWSFRILLFTSLARTKLVVLVIGATDIEVVEARSGELFLILDK